MNPVPPLRTTPEENPVRPLARNPGFKCKRCGSTTFERIPRYGFWQLKVLPFFDLYPWRCTKCAKITYQSKRTVDGR